MQEQLEILASTTEQREYAEKVPHVEVTKEFVCGWFDDTYHPNDACFRECFTSQELSALAEFDQKFEEFLAFLPSSGGTVEAWLADVTWRGVMERAARTRTRIEN